MLNILLRISTFVLLLIRGGYWYSQGKKAQEEKPGEANSSWQSRGGWLVSYGLEGFVFVQLLGLSVLPVIQFHTQLQLLGLLLVALGTSVSFVARKTLAANWSHAADYQIKKNHQLITTGIYQYIRHPIYLGLALSWIGAEMVAQSWLWVSFLALFIVFYVQGKREEKNFLASRFAKEYKAYMQKTKMLIPFVI